MGLFARGYGKYGLWTKMERVDIIAALHNIFLNSSKWIKNTFLQAQKRFKAGGSFVTVERVEMAD